MKWRSKRTICVFVFLILFSGFAGAYPFPFFPPPDLGCQEINPGRAQDICLSLSRNIEWEGLNGPRIERGGYIAAFIGWDITHHSVEKTYCEMHLAVDDAALLDSLAHIFESTPFAQSKVLNNMDVLNDMDEVPGLSLSGTLESNTQPTSKKPPSLEVDGMVVVDNIENDAFGIPRETASFRIYNQDIVNLHLKADGIPEVTDISRLADIPHYLILRKNAPMLRMSHKEHEMYSQNMYNRMEKLKTGAALLGQLVESVKNKYYTVTCQE